MLCFHHDVPAVRTLSRNVNALVPHHGLESNPDISLDTRDQIPKVDAIHGRGRRAGYQYTSSCGHMSRWNCNGW